MGALGGRQRANDPFLQDLSGLPQNRQLSSGAVDGLNLKAKLTMRKANGFQSLEHLQIALYHTLGALSEHPGGPHRFC